MRAAVMQGVNEVRLEDIPKPEIEPEGILIAVQACAVYGSDLRTVWRGNPRVKLPRVLGHEVIGTIVEMGKEVTPAIGCGKCSYCRSVSANMCAQLETIGFDFEGGFAEFMAVPAKAARQGLCIESLLDYLPNKRC